MKTRFLAPIVVVGFAAVMFSGLARADEPLKFQMHRVGTHRSEACGVADFNNDGKLDITAGEFLYLAPDWRAVKIRTIPTDINERGDGYSWDFMDAPLDVDGDGWIDEVSCSWHGCEMNWYKNPGRFDADTGDWAATLVEKNGNFEFGELVDADGDGVKDDILPTCAHVEWYEVGKLPDGSQGLIQHKITDQGHIWGAGVGDVNDDGRIDFLRPEAWYEAPADPTAETWRRHPLQLGGPGGTADHTPQILVHDFSGDGLNDILTSSAHKHGIFWYEKAKADGGEYTWTQHTIDDTWTQAHSLALADLDGDGDLDLLTGKRFRAHNGHDPEGDQPPGVYWYEFDRPAGQPPRWIKHMISFDQGIGSGMNIPVIDLDGDGDLDFVVTGKWGGPVWFENLGKP